MPIYKGTSSADPAVVVPGSERRR